MAFQYDYPLSNADLDTNDVNDNTPLTGREAADSVDQFGAYPNGFLFALGGVEVPVSAGVPTDANLDVPTGRTPTGAVLIYDDTNDKLYVRKPNGTYKAITVDV